MHKVLCSTGAVTGRENHYDYKILEHLSRKLKCDGFELMIDSDWYEDIGVVKDFLKKLKLCIPVAHADKDIGELISKGRVQELSEAYRLLEINCDMASGVGAEKLVLHL